jgi:hypothetical protein
MRDDALTLEVERRIYLIRGEKVLLNALEKKYNARFKIVIGPIRELMSPPEKPKRRIEFHS